MNATERKAILDFCSRLAGGLAEAIGKNCEVVVHDFEDPEHSIIAIANGHITGRKVGDTVDVLGLQLLRNPPAGDLLNYRTETKSGRILRSSSIFLRKDSGEIYGALCVNYDITGLMNLQQWLQETVSPVERDVHEEFESDVDSVLNHLIRDAIRSTGKEIAGLTREDKIAVITYLEHKGAFLIRYSVDRIAELLSISKYTIYNYLEEVKARHGEDGKRSASQS
ncbi:MAG: transcriptional regulator [Terriglobales bacterium]